MHRNIYLERYATPRTHVLTPPPDDLGLVVVIPSYKEPHLLKILNSLLLCSKPPCTVEVMVVLNYSQLDPVDVKNHTLLQLGELREWMRLNNSDQLIFHALLEKDIPHKIAGPGMARKIGMDEAVRRFEAAENPNGIITGLDADCLVAENYLVEIYNHWQRHPGTHGISIYFEHPLEGDFEDIVYESITAYELHLRYYINAQVFAGFPYAFQTVGSSFAVTSAAYQKQGGMNKRKAGEDFYFLHKIIPLGKYYNLTTTKVYPSPRPSDRVPFGTGRSVLEYLTEQKKALLTYNIEIFKDLKEFFSHWKLFFQSPPGEWEKILPLLPASVVHFLRAHNLLPELVKTYENCASEATFFKGFFRWFNAFQLMKYVHFARDNYYTNQPVGTAAKTLMQWKDIDCAEIISNRELLMLYRETDRDISSQASVLPTA